MTEVREPGPIRRMQTGRTSTPPPPNPGGISLADLVGDGLETTAANPPALSVATIARDALHTRLASHYRCVALFPDTLVGIVDRVRPDFIVIDRAALREGPWFGAEQAEGGCLIDEIGRLGKWSRKWDRKVLLLDDAGDDGLYTERLRSMAHYAFPSTEIWDELPERPRRRLIYHLVQEFATGAAVHDGDAGGGA